MIQRDSDGERATLDSRAVVSWTEMAMNMVLEFELPDPAVRLSEGEEPDESAQGSDLEELPEDLVLGLMRRALRHS